MKKFIITYKKEIIITLGITILNIALGFDARFTIINLLWLIVSSSNEKGFYTKNPTNKSL